jgi:polyhydroxybutyrate depolymerase
MRAFVRLLAFTVLSALSVIPAALADTMTINGVERSYLLAGARSPGHSPLVIVLHGQGGTGRQMMNYTRWDELAAQEKFVAVFPDAVGGNWQLTREPNADIDFIAKLIAKLGKENGVDLKRVYLTGLSRGGAFSFILACERVNLFAAVAPIIVSVSSYMLKSCVDRDAIPVALMNGTADPRIPYNGGIFHGIDGPVPVVSTDELVRHWRERNGCLAVNWGETTLPDLDPKDGSRVTRIASRCDPDQEVTLFRIDGGGHQLPSRPGSSPPAVTAKLGPQNHDIDGAQTIWAFFKPHRQ